MKTVSKKQTATAADETPDQDFDTYMSALEMTRKAILLLDEVLPKTVTLSIHDDLEAELLRIERERLELKERFRAYQQDSAGIMPPDQKTIANITALSDQVDGQNADQSQAQAILTLVGSVADTAASLFNAT